jgi:hypothetical protein
VQNQRLKWQAVVIAASALVALGALAAAIDQEQTAAVGSGVMNIGGTTTSTTPPVVPPPMASPTMKAPRPKGLFLTPADCPPPPPTDAG